MHALEWTEPQTLTTAASDGVLRWWDPRAARPLAGQCAAETGAALLSLAASTEAAQQYVGAAAQSKQTSRLGARRACTVLGGSALPRGGAAALGALPPPRVLERAAP